MVGSGFPKQIQQGGLMAAIDLVLIDDDPLVHLAWEMAAARSKRNIAVYDEPNRFWQDSTALPRTTPVYVDCQLGPSLRGEEISRKIKELGFEQVFLATGFPRSVFGEMPWLKGIVGKEPPAELRS